MKIKKYFKKSLIKSIPIKFERLSFMLLNKIKDIKYFFQKLFRGSSDLDLWNLKDHLSEIILKKLILFKSMKRHGHPNKISAEYWEVILDDMIYSFKALSQVDLGEDAFTKSAGKYKLVPLKKTSNYRMVTIKKPKIDTRALNAHRLQVSRGFKLFHKHYHNLWD